MKAKSNKVHDIWRSLQFFKFNAEFPEVWAKLCKQCKQQHTSVFFYFVQMHLWRITQTKGCQHKKGSDIGIVADLFLQLEMYSVLNEN